ncbi:MAG: hypothetical protein WCD18_08765 [Thermosynechococcaceae cyanobacterium]
MKNAATRPKRRSTQLVTSLQAGHRYQTLLGATGTGKTYTIAQPIERN